MDRVKFLKSAFFIVFLALASTKCHSYFVPVPVKPRPVPVPVKPLPPPPPSLLCLSQYALVNHACARMLLQPLNPPSPQESLAATSFAPPPLSPPSSPLPSSPSPPSPNNGTRLGHRRRHERAEQQGYPESLEEEQCCRWMQVVDAECVCSLLVHLPSILVRLMHNYTVVLSESCHITYQCAGEWKV